MVARALPELRPLMGDYAPTATIVKAMQAKVDAEEVLRTHIRDLQADYKAPREHPNQLEAVRSTATRTPTAPATPTSTSSWQMAATPDVTTVNMAGGYEEMDNQLQQ